MGKMEIGCNIGTFYRYGDDRYKKMKEFGFNYVDEFVRGLMEGESEEAFEAAFTNEKKLADEAGIKIYQVHAPFLYPPRDRTPEEREERFEMLVQSMRAAALLGTQNWVMHSIQPYYGLGDTEENLAESHKINVEFFHRLLPHAKKHGLTICFENTCSSKTRFVTPEETLSIVKEVNDENMRMCIDTGHCVHMNTWTAGETVRQAGKYVRAFHVHDSMGPVRDDHLMPFLGRTDWNDFYNALVEIDYEGVLCLETGPSGHLSPVAYETAVRALRVIANDILKLN